MDETDQTSEVIQQIAEGLTVLPGTLSAVVLAILAVAVAHGAQALLTFLLSKFSHNSVWRRLVYRGRWPVRLVFIVAALSAVTPVMDIGADGRQIMRHVLGILFIVAITSFIISSIHALGDLTLRKYTLDSEENNLQARKIITQYRVLQRTGVVVTVLFAAAAILMTFEQFREVGVSLLASAGFASIVVGLAARPVFSNLIAGIQIAITQPIRIEDAVIVEGEWGWIEEIAATYVVIRIWDWRRLVVPLTYFIEKPFQNWTRDGTALIGSVYLYLDYTVPVQAVRDKLEEFVRASDYWDGQVINLQVTETNADTVVLRALMSARNSLRAWDLRCEIREKLITWLQQTYPQALPRLRAEMVAPEEEGQPNAKTSNNNSSGVGQDISKQG